MTTQTANKQLPFLFICSLSILFVGMGITPLLPLYAVNLGASTGTAGLFLGGLFIAYTIGTLILGPLAGRVGLKRLLVLAGAISLPAVFFLGKITMFWQLFALTSVLWFAGGIGNGLIMIYVGLSAGVEDRGRWFSLISLTAPLGTLLGSLIVGRLVDMQGYSFMFTSLTLVWAVWPMVAFLKLEDRPVQTKKAGDSTLNWKMSNRERMPLLLLLLAIFFSMLTINAGRLGLPLVMNGQAYSPGAVSTAMAFGGLITLPFAYFLGLLSDRFGRKNILILGYIFATGSVLLLLGSNQTWHFWLAASLLLVALTVNGSVASAFATDLLTPRVLVKVLPLFTAVGSVAGILGFAAGGYLIESVGFAGLFIGAAVLALAAASFILPLHCEKQIAAVFEPGWACDLSFRPGGPTVTPAEVEPVLDPSIKPILEK
jgi:MFS family permease